MSVDDLAPLFDKITQRGRALTLLAMALGRELALQRPGVLLEFVRRLRAAPEGDAYATGFRNALDQVIGSYLAEQDQARRLERALKCAGDPVALDCLRIIGRHGAQMPAQLYLDAQDRQVQQAEIEAAFHRLRFEVGLIELWRFDGREGASGCYRLTPLGEQVFDRLPPATSPAQRYDQDTTYREMLARLDPRRASHARNEPLWSAFPDEVD